MDAKTIFGVLEPCRSFSKGRCECRFEPRSFESHIPTLKDATELSPRTAGSSDTQILSRLLSFRIFSVFRVLKSLCLCVSVVNSSRLNPAEEIPISVISVICGSTSISLSSVRSVEAIPFRGLKSLCLCGELLAVNSLSRFVALCRAKSGTRQTTNPARANRRFSSVSSTHPQTL